MYGPQAYENIFQTKIKKKYVYLIIEYRGDEHYYDYNSAIGLFDTPKEFEDWCIDDVVELNAEYSTIPFCHNTIIRKRIKLDTWSWMEGKPSKNIITIYDTYEEAEGDKI